MRFYCPNCQMEYDTTPSETITTKSGRVAYKANCPTCGQDMAEFIPSQGQESAANPSAAETPASTEMTPTAESPSPAPAPTTISESPLPPAETTPAQTTETAPSPDANGEAALELAQAALDQAASLVPPAAAGQTPVETKTPAPKSVLPLTSEPEEAAEPVSEETAEDILKTQPTQ